MGDSTLRDLLREWRDRGGAYERMLDVVRWRKQVGRTEKYRSMMPSFGQGEVDGLSCTAVRGVGWSAGVAGSAIQGS